MSEHYVEVHGKKIFVRSRGNGAPVVLLHGFPETGEAWNGVADRLAGRNRVMIFDLPGFGRSDPAPKANAREVSKLLLAAIDQAGADKFTLVGHDFGGSIAFRMALDAPQRIERLVVTNAPFRHLNVLRMPHLLALNMPVVPEVVLWLGGRQLVPLFLRLGARNRKGFDSGALAEYGRSLGDLRRARNALAYYRTMSRERLIGQLKSMIPGGDHTAHEPRRIEVPTLLVWGMRDPVLPPSVIATIERDIETCTVVRLPDVGHFVPEEAPAELAHEIDQFIWHNR